VFFPDRVGHSLLKNIRPAHELVKEKHSSFFKTRAVLVKKRKNLISSTKRVKVTNFLFVTRAIEK